MIDLVQVRKHLLKLFDGATGYIELRIFHPDGWVQPIFFDTVDSVLDYVERNKNTLKKCNVFFGVNPRSVKPDKGGGRSEHVKTSRFLFADLDFKEELTHNQVPELYREELELQGYARMGDALIIKYNDKIIKITKPDPHTLFEQLKPKFDEMGIKAPTLVVDSGFGYHIYVKLSEELPIEEWSKLQDYFVDKLGADKHTKDPARILRLAGTVNNKYPHYPVPVKIVYESDYELDPKTLTVRSNALPLSTTTKKLTTTQLSRIKQVVLPYWVVGYRHSLSLALGALFYWHRYPLEDALATVEAIAREAKDEELKDRLRAVRETYVRSEFKNVAYKSEEFLKRFNLPVEKYLPMVEEVKKILKPKKPKESVAYIPLKYKNHDFGWLVIEKIGENKYVAGVEKDGKTIIPKQKVPTDFIYSERKVNKLLGHVKKVLGEEDFNDFLGALQDEVARRMKLLKMDIPAEKIEDVEFDLELLKEFGIESEEEVVEFLHEVLEEEGSEVSLIAEFLMERFSFKTIVESGELLYYDKGVYRFYGEAKVEELVQKLLVGLGLKNVVSTHLVNEVVNYIKRSTYVSIREFQRFDEMELVNLKNGVLDLNTRELKPHSPKYLFLWQLPIEYNPNADCPKIKRFLTEIVRPEDVDTLIKIVAYCLMPGQPYQVAFYLYGTGANGKSTFANLLVSFLGRENVSSESLFTLETHRFATYELVGKLANVCAENPGDAIDELVIFKKITGGDLVPVERKFRDRYKTYLRCKLIFFGNELPKLKKLEQATLRRWILIQFPNQFRNGNPNLVRELTTPEELSGFLNLVLEKYKELKERGFETKSIEETRNLWLRAMNPIFAFIVEHVEEDEEGEVTNDEIWEAFYRYCKHYNIPFPYTSNKGGKAAFFKQLYDQLDALGIRYDRVLRNVAGTRYKAISGIKLVDLDKIEMPEEESTVKSEGEEEGESWDLSEVM